MQYADTFIYNTSIYRTYDVLNKPPDLRNLSTSKSKQHLFEMCFFSLLLSFKQNMKPVLSHFVLCAVAVRVENTH